MGLVKETGSLATSTANTFVDTDDWDEYWEDRDSTMQVGITYTEEQIIAALIKAGDYLNAMPWKGLVHNYYQSMSWPRYKVTNRSGLLVDSEYVPPKVQHAQMELAKRELVSADALMPDLDRGGKIKRTKVDVLETEWFEGASSETQFKHVKRLLVDYIHMGVSRTVERS